MNRFAETEEAARALGTDPQTGLTAAQVSEHRQRYGENRLPPPKSKSIFEMFLGSLNDRTLLILIGAALLALGVEVLQGMVVEGYSPHYIDGFAILGAVLVASLVTTLNEAQAAKQFKMLSAVRDDVPVNVLRDGHVTRLSILELVVGDIVNLSTGDRLPADGRLLSSVDLQVDQSTLTGESVPVDKGETDLEVKGGTTVTTGTGAMLIEAVGVSTEIGRLQATLTQEEDAPTPLQERLAKLADQIGLVGLGAAVLTFSALSVSAAIRGELSLAVDFSTIQQLIQFSIVAVTIVVVAVPEGLPLAVTISLAYSVRSMARDNNLVRKLESCETMGAATVVCSDKTGTLTKNKMAVVEGLLDGVDFSGPPDPHRLSPEVVEQIAAVAAVDSTAFLEKSPDGQIQYLGNPTEAALLALIAGWGEDWRRRRSQADTIHQLGFSSDRKRMSTLIAEPDRSRTLLVKGAPEVIFDRAKKQVKHGKVVPLDKAGRRDFERVVRESAEHGHRVLALAYRRLGAEADNATADDLERDLVLIGVVAIADPVRPEVAEAIAKCRRAGVDVKMVTGDNPVTARSIARQIDLLREGDLVVDGREFRGWSDDQVVARLDRLRVLARSVPSDKHRLVTLLKSHGEVVAVTGDGTNDAPALKAADVGFAMGLAGTEVAKEASDIVLLDDNFSSIVKGIQWGRGIFENIRKFLQFQLTVNVVALSTAFLAALFGYGIPLNTVQLLWVNLIMDTMAALALATEPPPADLLDQPPHGRHAPLITKNMWTHILTMGVYMVVVLMVVLGTDIIIPAEASTLTRNTFVFNTFVMMQLFNEVNARSTRFDRGVLPGITKSPLFISVIAATLVTQLLIIQFGGALFRTTQLTVDEWLMSIAVGATVLVLGKVIRSVGRLVSETPAALPAPATVAKVPVPAGNPRRKKQSKKRRKKQAVRG